MGIQPQAALSWNASTVAALSAAIANGAVIVTYPQGGSVTYASLAAMQQLLDRMVRYVNSQGDGLTLPPARGSVFLTR